MRTWIDENSRFIKISLFLGNLLIFLHFHGGIANFFGAILILSIPLALCYGTLTNLFVPTGTRNNYYGRNNSRINNDTD
jgi:hypothetical protein